MPAYLGQNGCGSGHAWVRLGCIGGSRWNRAGLNRLLNRRKCGNRKALGMIRRDSSLRRSRAGAPGWSGGCRELSLGVPDSGGGRAPVGIIMREGDLGLLNGRREVGRFGDSGSEAAEGWCLLMGSSWGIRDGWRDWAVTEWTGLRNGRRWGRLRR